MHSLLLIVLIVLCYLGQNFFNKMYSSNYRGPSPAAAVSVFAAAYGLIVGIVTLTYNGFQYTVDIPTMILGAMNGLALFLYNLAFIRAGQTGPYTFQCLMSSSANISVPLLFTLFFWGDRLTVLKMAGIFVMLSALVVFNSKGLNFEDAKKGYLRWVGLLFLSNGAYCELVDAQHRIAAGGLRNEMIITTFLVSAVISAIFLLATKKVPLPDMFRMGRKSFVFLLLCSICAAVAINVLMYVLAVVPASILFCCSSGGLLIANTALGILVLHEKPEAHKLLGIAIAVCSLVMMNI